ncbi:AzlD family protein [Desulfonatronum thioautotrophicum]|uniref:AzlD family protein n=1 Tax=Desulfonatronum thioautotrophicum TaxID=617001 RepID=UPI0005EB90C6|nr:AzlD domain-containing protein [Desulfonatronum thioautotrophicum]
MGAELAETAASAAPGSGVLLVLLGMAAVTYLTRAAGLYLISRVSPTQRVEAFLRHVPASILVAIVIPSLAQGGLAERSAAGITALVAILTRNLIAALIAGVLAVVALRAII